MAKAWLVVAGLLLSGAALYAADFWEQKKFPEWTEKEIKKITSDSPWARRVDVPLGVGMAGGGGRGRGGGRGKGGGGGMSGGGGGFGAESSSPGAGPGGGGADDFGARSSPSGEGPGATPTLPLVIRWQSAMPIRQAIAKARWGAEATTSAEAAKMLARQEQFYIVAIGGVPAGMLAGANPEQLKSAAFLRISKLAPVAAMDVRVNRAQPVSEIFLVFPRSQQGAHVITLEDKEVEVVTNLGRLELRRKFRLKDMVFDGKLEL